jgi:SAM-dependent methyltransferase
MIEQNTRKLGSPRVRYQIADLFAWEPECRYDLVFFAFWLSHVPPDALDAFLEKVRRAVRPGGSLVIVDRSTLIASDEHSRVDATRVRRQLVDGRSFTIVTVPCDPADVASRLGHLGFEVAVRRLEDTWFFLHAQSG